MEPLEVVEIFNAAWADHGLDGAVALITEDCIFDNTDPAPDGTRCVGRAAIRKAWRPIFDVANAHFEAEETGATGERVVQLWTYSSDGGHVRGVDVITVRDGQVSDKLFYVKG